MNHRFHRFPASERARASGRELLPILLIISALCLYLGRPASGRADPPGVVSTTISERGACYAVWTSVTRSTDPATGQTIERTRSFTQLENGLHYWQGNQWMESKDLIELTATGAAAVQGPNEVTFSPTTGLADPVTVRLVSASGKVLQSRVLGLFYFDIKSGRRVAIANLKESTGVLYPPNQVLYPDCLQDDGGANNCSLLFTYAKGGFSQDVLLSGPLAPPEAYGLDPALTRLQVITVFYQPPTPGVRRLVLDKFPDPIQALGMVAPDLTDDFLDFSDFILPVGHAVAWDKGSLAAEGAPARVQLPDPSDPEGVVTGKQWVDQGDGTCQLIESVPYAALAAKLKPLQTAATRERGMSVARRQVGPTAKPRGFQVAKGPLIARGVVLDYVLLTTSQSSYTFQSGNTYLISGLVGIGPGWTVFQTNVCLKSAGTNGGVYAYGNVSLPSGGPASVVFTSKDDDVYGAWIYSTNSIGASTGAPTNTANQAFWIYYPGSSQTVGRARFRWAKRGLQIDENYGVGDTFAVTACKFENSATGIYFNLNNNYAQLTTSTYCNVTTPTSGGGGQVTGSLIASADVSDASQYGPGYSEQETTVAINPLDTSKVISFAIPTDSSNEEYGLLRCLTTNGGINWTSSLVATGGISGLPQGYCDEIARFDDYGNLFFSYLGTTNYAHTNVVIALSTDSGNTFTTLTNYHWSVLDKPALAVAAGSVWLTFLDLTSNVLAITGASVSSNGTVGTFLNPTRLTLPMAFCNKANLAIGPDGQVVLSFVELHSDVDPNYSLIHVYTNLGGLQNTSWQYSGYISNGFARTGLPSSWSWTEQDGFLAYDRSSGPYRGRLYLVYTDVTSTNANDTDIYLRYSTNNSANWSAATRLNTDNSHKSQFFPALAVDPASGCVAVAWLDCRNDTGNTNVQPFGVISDPGGTNFTPNLRLSPGASNAWDLTIADWFGYGDYTFIDFRKRVLHFVWADCSNYLNNNPDGKSGMDMYSVRFCY